MHEGLGSERARLLTVAPGGRGATQAIHDDLRSRILTGDVPAGSELSQAQVAKDYGVSRGPVREAFRLLQREGLIEAEINHRGRVAELSVDDVEHVYALRVVNEVLALTVTVPRLAVVELDELDRLVRAIEESFPREYPAWEQQHQRFHTLLVGHAGERMRRSLAQWSEHAERYRRVFFSDGDGGWLQGAQEHAQLAGACRAGDVEGATRLLARHLSRAALTLIASMDPGHDPVLLRSAIRQATATAGDPR